jgi:predicted PurR-regulated permease PerM
VKRGVAVIALYLFCLVTLVAADLLLYPYLEQETSTFSARLPEFTRQFEQILSGGTGSTGKNPLIEETARRVLADIIKPGELLTKTINYQGLFSQAAPFLMALVLVPFFVFFLLKDWPGMLKRFMAFVPPAYVETTVSVFTEINILIGNYLRGVALDCIAVGIIASAGLWLVGISYPISLGILTGAANIIPYIGPLAACGAACLIAVIQSNSLGAVVPVIILYAAVKLTDDLVLQPLTIGKSVRLHPMLLVIAIIAGEKLFGIAGMIFAVPVVTACQKVAAILLHRRHHQIKKGPDRPVPAVIV